MTTNQNTLDRYLKADEGQRMTLFLFHRELRGEFEEIEMAAMEAADQEDSQETGRSTIGDWIVRLWARIRAKNFQFDG